MFPGYLHRGGRKRRVERVERCILMDIYWQFGYDLIPKRASASIEGGA